jgi:hypothetical protein
VHGRSPFRMRPRASLRNSGRVEPDIVRTPRFPPHAVTAGCVDFVVAAECIPRGCSASPPRGAANSLSAKAPLCRKADASAAARNSPVTSAGGGDYELVAGYCRVAGTLPPFSASFRITALCSQMFMAAESFLSPL